MLGLCRLLCRVYKAVVGRSCVAVPDVNKGGLFVAEVVADEDNGGVLEERLLPEPADERGGKARRALDRGEVVALYAAVAVGAAVAALEGVGVHCVHRDEEGSAARRDVGQQLLCDLEELSVLDAPLPDVVGALVRVALLGCGHSVKEGAVAAAPHILVVHRELALRALDV